MEQTSIVPEFASRRQARLWLLGEFMRYVALGFMVSLPFAGYTLEMGVGFVSSMGLSIWLSVVNKPSSAESWKTRPALFRAASDRLGGESPRQLVTVQGSDDRSLGRVTILGEQFDRILYRNSPTGYDAGTRVPPPGSGGAWQYSACNQCLRSMHIRAAKSTAQPNVSSREGTGCARGRSLLQIRALKRRLVDRNFDAGATETSS